MNSTTIAARVSVFCIFIHAFIFGSLHFLEPELSPSTNLISDYFQTSSSWLVSIALLFFASTWASLSIALGAVSGSRFLIAGRILFAMAFVAILVGILFPESLDPRTGSLLSRIQNLLARPGLFLGVILSSLGFINIPEWKRRSRILLTLSVLLAIMLLITIRILLPIDLGGIGQRLIFLMLYFWVSLTATRIIQTSVRLKGKS